MMAPLCFDALPAPLELPAARVRAFTEADRIELTIFGCSDETIDTAIALATAHPDAMIAIDVSRELVTRIV